MSKNNMLDGAQVIVDYLIQQKVPYAFGLCGHGNIQFIDALHERQSDIKTISVHHESVCGFMADAYYRVSDFLLAEHFMEDAHQQIFTVAASLIKAGKLTIVASGPIAHLNDDLVKQHLTV